MKPIADKGWTVLNGGSREDGAKIEELAVLRAADDALYSLWRPSWDERLKILIGNPVAVGVLSQRQPPITVVVGRAKIPGLFMAILIMAAALTACGNVVEVKCGKVLRKAPPTGGFWGVSAQTAVDLGDRVVTASGGRSLLPGDRACVQLKSESGPFITSEGATR